MNSQYPLMSGSRVFAAYLGDMRFELTKMLRTPMFAVPTLLFPLMFFVLFGVVMGSARGNGQQSLYAFASFGVLGAMAPGLFGFGVSLAFEREQGMLLFRQAVPMPPGSYLLARMIMAMIFVAISSLALIAMGVLLAHMPLTFGQCLTFLVMNVFGVLPFCALGMFVGTLVSGQAAPAIINLIYIPMSFLAGLFIPMEVLPAGLRQIAPLWPTHHLLQLTRAELGLSSFGSPQLHVAALLGATVLFFSLAMRKLSGSGIRLLGGARAGGSYPLRRAFHMGVFAISLGLVIAGVTAGNAPHAATKTAATSNDAGEPVPDASGSSAPVGVAAPDKPLIADFDHADTRASYGLGFSASDDKMRGGNSSAAQKVVEGALEVSGEVGTAIQYPFAGTSFLPNGTPGAAWAAQGFMDYSRKHTLSFRARGDGHEYMVMMMGPALDTIPAMSSFVAAPEWQEVHVPLKNMASIDLERVKLISFGTMTPGAFRFQIDDVRLE
jgi:ABC-2 type transport system permease protein